MMLLESTALLSSRMYESKNRNNVLFCVSAPVFVLLAFFFLIFSVGGVMAKDINFDKYVGKLENEFPRPLTKSQRESFLKSLSPLIKYIEADEREAPKQWLLMLKRRLSRLYQDRKDFEVGAYIGDKSVYSKRLKRFDIEIHKLEQEIITLEK